MLITPCLAGEVLFSLPLSTSIFFAFLTGNEGLEREGGREEGGRSSGGIKEKNRKEVLDI